MKSKEKQQTRGLFMGIGMVVALAGVITAFEWKSIQEFDPITSNEIRSDIDPIIPPTTIEQPEPPKPKIKPKFVEVIDEPDPEDLIEFQLDDILPDDIIPDPEFLEEPLPEEKVEEYVDFADEMPTPKDGYTRFYNAMAKEIKYPAQARRMGIEGKVYLQFIINKAGEINDVVVARGIGAGCDEEAMRAIKALNMAWKPGRQRSIPVNVRMVIPIVFSLN